MSDEDKAAEIAALIRMGHAPFDVVAQAVATREPVYPAWLEHFYPWGEARISCGMLSCAWHCEPEDMRKAYAAVRDHWKATHE